MANGAIGYGDLEQRNYGGAMPVLPPALRRISWGAVFAGFIVAVMISLVLALLGMAIGLGAVDPAREANPFSGLGPGAAIWWVASSLIALFLGGWVAARMAGVPRGFDGAVHGVLTWGLVSLATFFLIGSAIGRIIGGAGSLVGQGLGLAGQGLSAAAPKAADAAKDMLRDQGITLGAIKKEAEQLLSQTGKPGLQPEALEQQARQAGQAAQAGGSQAAQAPDEAGERMQAILQRIQDQGKGVASQADREAAVNILVNRGQTRAQAEATVDRWQATLQQASQKLDQTKAQAEAKAREIGQTAASGMSQASLWAFIGLLLGGFAAALGGRLGVPRENPVMARPVRP
jgi:hypothetical protein